jgi:hypothetical protein
MGIVRFALRFPHTFYVVAALILFLGVVTIRSMPTDQYSSRMPRIRMVDGFNEGWIDFERAGEHRQGTVTLETVVAGLTGKGDAA